MTTVKLIKMPDALADDDWIELGFILYGSTKRGYFRLYEPDVDIPNDYVEWIEGDPMIDADGNDIPPNISGSPAIQNGEKYD